jgi:glycosyltransferase 2 family protein
MGRAGTSMEHRGRRGYASGVPDSRLTGLRENPWLRAGLLTAAVGLAVYGLASQWPQVQADLAKLAWYDVAGAAVCAVAGLGCMMLAWRALLADLGSPLPRPAAIRVMFVGQLGKYVPGAVWAVAAQVELARDHDVPRRRSGTASLVAMATTLAVGLIAAGVTLPFTSANAARHYWWALAITPLAAACLYPPVNKFCLDLALKAMRRPPLEKPVSAGGMARALAWTTLGWLCYGAHAWFLISVYAGHAGHVFALSLGAYALAWSVGFLIIFFPGGIGPRELALIAVLAPVMPSASALVVALTSRVVMTIGDLIWAGVGLVLGRAQAPVTRGVQGDASPPREVREDGSPPREVREDGSPPREVREDGSPPREVRGDGSPPKGVRGDGSPPKGVRGDGSPRAGGSGGAVPPWPAQPAGKQPSTAQDREP